MSDDYDFLRQAGWKVRMGDTYKPGMSTQDAARKLARGNEIKKIMIAELYKRHGHALGARSIDELGDFVTALAAQVEAQERNRCLAIVLRYDVSYDTTEPILDEIDPQWREIRSALERKGT